MTRMNEHLLKQHPNREGVHRSIKAYLDRPFLADHQLKAEKLLATVLVSHGLAYNALESAHMAAFCRSLRPDFRLPSRRTLQKRVKVRYQDVLAGVEKCLTEGGPAEPLCVCFELT